MTFLKAASPAAILFLIPFTAQWLYNTWPVAGILFAIIAGLFLALCFLTIIIHLIKEDKN